MFTSIFRRVLFPGAGGAAHGLAVPEGAEAVGRPLDDGQVEAWFFIGDGVSSEAPGPLVIYAHGNGELIDQWPDRLRPYREMGVSLLLVEYRGYGRSAGSPSQSNIAEDFRHLYDATTSRPDVDGDRVAFHGRSLGGGVVCDLHRSHPARALVLESTFTSVRDLASRMGVPKMLVPDPFDSLGAATEAPVPTLVFHGDRDQTVPVLHGRRLAEAIPGAELVISSAGHNDLVHNQAYWARIRELLKKASVLD